MRDRTLSTLTARCFVSGCYFESFKLDEGKIMSKTAIITGGNRGIGLGIAAALVKEGWNLAICATREEAECAEVLTALRNDSPKVYYRKMNLAERESRETGLAAILKEFGKINLLVNNAGVAPEQRHDVLEMSLESYRRVMQINLEGPFFLTQAVAGIMIERRKHSQEPMSIVNISSVSANVASVSRGEYCISKAGLSMVTQLWAVRLAEHDIPVFEIRPGIIRSDMTAAVREKYDRLIAEGLVPQNRWGTPEDVGKAVAMLARGDLPYSTGQVIQVDGGQTLQRL